ncbi:MAG: DUF1622 domain-containing protein [Desulfuromonadales bacterium]|nr:DUF1622 domain-containing protein [Desulfuromonadales bacterium]
MVLQLIDGIALLVGVFGVLTIMWGSLKALVRYVRTEYRNFASDQADQTTALRHSFGTDLLLGLEFLIAADILHTLIKPDIESLIILGSIVAIRTVISYFLTREIQRTDAASGRAAELGH